MLFCIPITLLKQERTYKVADLPYNNGLKLWLTKFKQRSYRGELMALFYTTIIN